MKKEERQKINKKSVSAVLIPKRKFKLLPRKAFCVGFCADMSLVTKLCNQFLKGP